MKITGSKMVGVVGVPPVTPVVAIDSKLPPKTFIKQPHTASKKAGEPEPDVILEGRLGGKTLPPLELYGPDGKMVETPSACGTPRAR